MYFDSAPIFPPPEPLHSSDYRLYGFRFEEIFLRKIPTAQQVRFLSQAEFEGVDIPVSPKQKKAAVAAVFSRRRPAALGTGMFLFPVPAADRDDLAVLVGGVDEVIVKRASPQWLSEIAGLVEQEFAAVKTATTDPVTGLYNSSFFTELLSHSAWPDDFQVVLVESLPPARSPKKAFAHVQRIARLLDDYNHQSLPLFHFGQAVFAYVVTGRNRAFLTSFCLALTSYTRDSGVLRIHAGFSGYAPQRHGQTLRFATCNEIFDEAWHALHVACRRGPIAFCGYDFIIDPGAFPLHPPARSTRARFGYRVRAFDSFALVMLRPHYRERGALDDVVLPYLADDCCVVDEAAYLVIQAGAGVEEAARWARALIESIRRKHGESCLLSAGVSEFPFHNYPKAEILRNCQKALLHGTFLDPGSVVVFDSLSLNVSGDAYYGEGDFAGAAAEYRRGLAIAPDDVNLLNSLGVTYALMNRPHDALAMFAKVLTIDPANFMALYNQGMGEQVLGNYPDAGRSFAQALSCHDPADEEQAGVLGELRFRLGLSHFHQGRYRECVDTLKPWYEEREGASDGARGCRYIGISLYRLGRLDEASTWLQRGLAHDESDAEALSMLGDIYRVTGQGDEIALRLTEKSVELEPGSADCLLRHARTLTANGMEREALDTLRRCCRFPAVRCEAWLVMARLYERRGDRAAVTRCLRKISAATNGNGEVWQEAKRLLITS